MIQANKMSTKQDIQHLYKQKADIIDQITRINNNHTKVMNDELKPLFQLAQKWIENEELLIQQLQNQL
jgi:tRNA C32,U32 (ribose-2'-O)-methylase TrmJ